MNEPHGMILIDITPGFGGEFDRSFLERTGHDVVVCHGPEHGDICPLLAGTGCEKVDQAHGIVFALDLDREQHRAILHRYREVTRPEVPIRAVVRPGQRDEVRRRTRRVRCVGARADGGRARWVRRRRRGRGPWDLTAVGPFFAAWRPQTRGVSWGHGGAATSAAWVEAIFPTAHEHGPMCR